MICTSLDDFIRDKDQAYWIAELDDGKIVYQDDDRPDYDEKYAWKRLKTYCSKNDKKIKSISIRFRSNKQVIFESKDYDGFFWRLKLIGSPAHKKVSNYQLFGIIEKDTIHVKHVRVPELIFEEDDIRPITKDCEETLIWNKKSSRSTRKKKQPPQNI